MGYHHLAAAHIQHVWHLAPCSTLAYHASIVACAACAASRCRSSPGTGFKRQQAGMRTTNSLARARAFRGRRKLHFVAASRVRVNSGAPWRVTFSDMFDTPHRRGSAATRVWRELIAQLIHCVTGRRAAVSLGTGGVQRCCMFAGAASDSVSARISTLASMSQTFSFRFARHSINAARNNVGMFSKHKHQHICLAKLFFWFRTRAVLGGIALISMVTRPRAWVELVCARIFGAGSAPNQAAFRMAKRSNAMLFWNSGMRFRHQRGARCGSIKHVSTRMGRVQASQTFRACHVARNVWATLARVSTATINRRDARGGQWRSMAR